MKNENKGITLVALVVTVIILLILAGVAIAQLTENGLFEKAKLAKEKTMEAQEQENKILNEYEDKISEIVDLGTRNQQGIVDEIDLSTLDIDAKGQITINNKIVNITGAVEKSISPGGVILTLPENVRPSTEKYGSFMMYSSAHGYSHGYISLKTNGQIINPSSVTRTYFNFNFTYKID